jgi:hypothetical protein
VVRTPSGRVPRRAFRGDWSRSVHGRRRRRHREGRPRRDTRPDAEPNPEADATTEPDAEPDPATDTDAASDAEPNRAARTDVATLGSRHHAESDASEHDPSVAVALCEPNPHVAAEPIRFRNAERDADPDWHACVLIGRHRHGRPATTGRWPCSRRRRQRAGLR